MQLSVQIKSCCSSFAECPLSRIIWGRVLVFLLINILFISTDASCFNVGLVLPSDDKIGKIDTIIPVSDSVKYQPHAISHNLSPDIATGIQHDMTAPLLELEKELAPITFQILNHPSLEYKDSLNRIFVRRMMTILKRPDSYDYRFDSLKTISRLFPNDNVFRIFSWSITDADAGNNYKNSMYFGFVQRRIADAKNQPQIILTPLIDRRSTDGQIENRILSPTDWFGALYYTPKNSPTGVLCFNGKVPEFSPINGKKRIRKVKYYILLGLNQNDIFSNYKVVDVITFPDKDSGGIQFGAPIFYVNGYPLCRKIFKYSDNSPFSLNYHNVTITNRQTGPLARRKKMIVFDHLSAQRYDAKKQTYDIGSDGTTDALFFAHKAVRDDRKGFFVFVRDVKVYIPSTQQYSPRYLRRQAKKEYRRLRRSVR